MWIDELRGAPQLELKNVRLQIVNRGGNHQFGLRAVPPAKLAGPLDVRGDLTGTTVTALADWNGKLFLDLDYADIAAWRTWVPFPIEFPRGTGGVRTWLTFAQDRLTDAIVDVRLANVRTRLEKNLPELDLTELSGRLGWKMSGVRLRGHHDGAQADHRRRARDLPPIDFLLRFDAGVRQRGRSAGSSASTRSISRRSWCSPITCRCPPKRASSLREHAPKGHLQDVQVRWTGDWRDPAQYSAKGRFAGLAMNGAGKVPGFQGVSGSDRRQRARRHAPVEHAERRRRHAARVPRAAAVRRAHRAARLDAQRRRDRGAAEQHIVLQFPSRGHRLRHLPDGGRFPRQSSISPAASRAPTRATRAATSRSSSGSARATGSTSRSSPDSRTTCRCG